MQAELEQGNRLALEERYVEALHHYRRSLELYPGYSQALYNMARVLQRMGEREMAEGTVTLRRLADGIQKSVPAGNVARWLTRLDDWTDER